MTDQRVVARGTYDWKLDAPQKDGVDWDLSGVTVSVYFQDPARNVYGPFTATVTSATATYRNLAALLKRPGAWFLWFKLVSGGVELWSEAQAFEVWPGPL